MFKIQTTKPEKYEYEYVFMWVSTNIKKIPEIWTYDVSF